MHSYNFYGQITSKDVKQLPEPQTLFLKWNDSLLYGHNCSSWKVVVLWCLQTHVDWQVAGHVACGQRFQQTRLQTFWPQVSKRVSTPPS